jgi:hypothetical protein
VRIRCPSCKAGARVDVPTGIVESASHLTTVSVRAGFACEHAFQLFLDKNFKVRGYQKVDYEISPEPPSPEAEPSARGEESPKKAVPDDSGLLEALVLSENFVKHEPSPANFQAGEDPHGHEANRSKSKEEIYEEFWEFIDEDHPDFQDLIASDERRR